ncbi:MAG: NosD domain-containing protein [Planctomycetota bacterium]
MIRAALALALACTAMAALAGPLTPPAGAVSSTGKTTDQLEPRTIINAQNTPGDAGNTFVISRPGSYYLTGDVTGESSKNGIRVTSPGVTIDLNGFTLRGVPNSGIGIRAVAADGLVIKNGRISNWGEEGVFASLANGTYADVSAENNGLEGFIVGSDAIVLRCRAIGNGDDGITATNRARIVDFIAHGNTGDGIDAGNGSIASGCVATENGRGFDLALGSIAEDCVASDNQGDGFELSSDSTIVDSVARNNGRFGIGLSSDSVVERCNISGNDAAGIRAGFDCSILNNIIYRNKNSAAPGTPVTAGIQLIGQSNRVEGNRLLDNDVGIRATDSFNLIISNTFRTHIAAFDLINTTNTVGTIVSATQIPSFTGNTAASSGVGTTDPMANLIY